LDRRLVALAAYFYNPSNTQSGRHLFSLSGSTAHQPEQAPGTGDGPTIVIVSAVAGDDINNIAIANFFIDAS
jgi:hypothetical protein